MAIGTVERAYQLAPECETVDELRKKLMREGFTSVDQYLRGTLRKDLQKLLKPAD